jgi:cell shape-determining protein MreD
MFHNSMGIHSLLHWQIYLLVDIVQKESNYNNEWVLSLHDVVGTFHTCHYQATNTQFMSVETKQWEIVITLETKQ